jgi:hypothetical protein
VSGYQTRLRLPPQAALAEGQPKGADAPMNQSREAHPLGAAAPLPLRGACQSGRQSDEELRLVVARQANGLISAAGEAHAARMRSL